MAMVSAVRGYRCIVLMPEKMNKEKESTLKALGAEIVIPPTDVPYNDPESHINTAIDLCKEIPNSIILNQSRSPGNPLTHYDGTAEEISITCNRRIDAVVVGAGTGGTTCSLARKIKERLPACKIIGTDPVGSILAQPEHLNGNLKETGTSYEVEGIGYDFIPTVLDRSLVDKWYKTIERDSLRLARELIRLEGILVGGSSGDAVWAALEVIRDLGFTHDEKRRVVVILPDGVRNYMSKFLNNEWMMERDLQ